MRDLGAFICDVRSPECQPIYRRRPFGRRAGGRADIGGHHGEDSAATRMLLFDTGCGVRRLRIVAAHLVASPFNRRNQGLGRDRAIGSEFGALGRQIDRGRGHARQFRHCLLDSVDARRTRHAFHSETEVGVEIRGGTGDGSIHGGPPGRCGGSLEFPIMGRSSGPRNPPQPALQGSAILRRKPLKLISIRLKQARRRAAVRRIDLPIAATIRVIAGVDPHALTGTTNAPLHREPDLRPLRPRYYPGPACHRTLDNDQGRLAKQACRSTRAVGSASDGGRA